MNVRIGKDGAVVIADFSPVQAYKIAIRMEKDGIEFYEGLNKTIKDAQARQEVVFLIAQEKEHLKTFQGLLNKEKESGADDFEEDDIVDYLNSHVFEPSEYRHTGLEEALNRERRSIVFYEGCIAQSKDKAAGASFSKILEEEKKHLAKFAELLRNKCIKTGKGCIL